jgi:plasmid stability protein
MFLGERKAKSPLRSTSPRIYGYNWEQKATFVIIEVPDDLATALFEQAKSHGISADRFVREVLERELASLRPRASGVPFKTGRGMFAKYGQAPSDEELDANRKEMFGSFRQRPLTFAAVADTHTALWHLFDDSRLSAAASCSHREHRDCEP